MSVPSLLRALRGPFNFLRPEPEEIRRLVPDSDRTLPSPQSIYQDDESATPILGFPILLSPGLTNLRQALESYVRAEEQVQLAMIGGRTFDPKPHREAWDRYRLVIGEITDHVTRANYGRHYPGIFWLFHSIAVARLLKETPRRLLQHDPQLGRAHGDKVKYKVFHRFLDRVVNLTYDNVQRLAQESAEEEESLFPALLTRMGDNVLIMTEDHISHNLAELGSYFTGCLGLDGLDFRRRLDALADWHDQELRRDRGLPKLIRHLLRIEPEGDPDALLKTSGYVSYLASRPSYQPERLLPPDMVKVWESLLLKLKEFELLLALRRLVLPIRREHGQLVSRDPGLRQAGPGRRELVLSAATRPLDFTIPWVVDPLVHRFGLMYDITSFSEIVSVLDLAGRDIQDASYRMIFHFQRWVNRLALQHRLKLEKYLGDGALYSARHPQQLLLVAIRLQRRYARATREGFPLNRGMRLALNFGAYRLLPLQTGEPGESERYEFLGQGIVELSRLVTGKATREIDEVRNLLISRGYPALAVDRFFAPIQHQNVDVVEKGEEAREFYAYINRNGNLVNEGIVATEGFVGELDLEVGLEGLRLGIDATRSFVVFRVEQDGDGLWIGMRKLGTAKFKGLEPMPVYEVVDGAGWQVDSLDRLTERSLLKALERQFVSQMGAASAV